MPPRLIIERIDPDGLDSLEPLWAALVMHHAEIWSVLPARRPADSWPRRRRQYRAWLAGEGSFVLAARRQNRLVGYAMVAVAEGDETFATGDKLAELETLVVAAGERGARVGSALLNAALAELERQGIDDILVGVMHGNDAARRFYERRGFTPFVNLLYAQRDAAQRAAGNQKEPT
jgi:ribosomal protein S18 acetylase RimI-like enzyme